MIYSYSIKRISLTHYLINSYFYAMTSIIIHAENKSDISLLKELSKKMGLSAHILSDDEKEDINLGQAIKENAEGDNMLHEEAVAYYRSLKKQ